jgi:hypothetical protein
LFSDIYAVNTVLGIQISVLHYLLLTNVYQCQFHS